jgi:hypothetical protein
VNGINYRGVFLCSREELRQMLTQKPLLTHDGRPGNRGSIVNIASQLGLVGRPCAPAYCGSKAAVMALTRSDAIDVGAYGLFLSRDAAVPAFCCACCRCFFWRSLQEVVPIRTSIGLYEKSCGLLASALMSRNSLFVDVSVSYS